MASSYVVSDNVMKNKVIFIIGATGTGKSRLSIDLAIRFPSERPCDSFSGLDIVSNKVPISERLGVTHHLLGQVEQDVDYSSVDFCRDTIAITETILKSNRVPIIVGGSNSFLEALVEDSVNNFKSCYERFFIWMDVSFPVLDSYVSKRVDQMIDAGLVDEVREIFDKKADYNRGVRRAIGVPEMHEYFLSEAKLDKTSKDSLLASSIGKIKENTCALTRSQVQKILRLRDEIGWDIHRFDATSVLEKIGEEANRAWNDVVLQPCTELVTQFLTKEKKDAIVQQELTINNMSLWIASQKF
ncbi:hypothetical protein M9H77_18716 [Catharanthus roseus]|uniref:Uncharacterized protein n=1 Tax=Catharanthus roseus TaxID=4058 RepID=A0ACC0B8G4_CATRO|nr:hypothetical protein M9H77_18716 [Catharanthus roseus]